MQVVKHPTAKQLQTLLTRPASDSSKIEASVAAILSNVKANGDKALKQYALQFDKVTLKSLRVTATEISQAVKQTPLVLQQAIKAAYKNIYKFHAAQKQTAQKIETTKGIVCWRESKAIQNVGLYIPGGSAPLFSTVLMLGIPAKIAGCKNVVLCTPCDSNGKINPAILYTAQLCGITQIYKLGGAQAIAAMAYGTQTVPQVNKIFGPGNQYVTLAKQLVQKNGLAIDMPAGPSEVLVVGDDTAEPSFVAADLLAQAEHGSDSQVIFVALTQAIANKVLAEVDVQLNQLPRKQVAAKSLSNSRIIIVKNKAEAASIINTYAPEHLIIAVKDESYFLKNTFNAGSVFIGNYTPESAGDYASGTNHTLPTNGYATAYSGVSLDSFIKKITYQKISLAGIKQIGKTVEVMAEAEGLHAHKNSVTVRLKKLSR